MITTIGFDADDTLWHNETHFWEVQTNLRAILQKYGAHEDLDQRLLETERRNLGYFGYGAKGFALSMIETAIELTDGAISAADIGRIVGEVKRLLSLPPRLVEGARETVERTAREHRLLLITKGDLFEQEVKIARSGLAEFFAGIEIVSEKDEGTYRRVLHKHGVGPDEFLMVGNSLRSDVLPVLQIGGQAVHVPFVLTWAHEVAAPPAQDYRRIEALELLPELLLELRKEVRT